MSYIFRIPISRDYGEIISMLKWAKDHCPSFITNNVEFNTDRHCYRFYFADEKDYTWFSLRWS